MRLNSKDFIAGYPVLRVRDLLKRWDSPQRTAFVAGTMRLSERDARPLVERLIALDYLEVSGSEASSFQPTRQGGALASAKARAPILRRTAERRLVELVERMTRVNESDAFLVGVEEAFVFGSYLSDAPRLGDLDISLRLYPKGNAGDFVDQCIAREARDPGVAISRAHDRVFKFLRQRATTYSFHLNEPLLQNDPTAPRRAIFLARKPVPLMG